MASILHYSYLSKFNYKMGNMGNLSFLNLKHDKKKNISIRDIKEYLKKNKVNVR